MRYDVIILTTKKNLAVLRIALPYIRKNIVNGGNIYVIASVAIQSEINAINDCSFVNEDEVYPGLTYSKVASLMKEICGSSDKCGWYFQQFLKLAWSYKCKTDHYIVIDADTIPMTPIQFQDSEGMNIFTQKTEYNQPYFDTINKLFSGKVTRCVDFSFVAEHMIFSVHHMCEMINLINGNHSIEGDSFYAKILYAVGQNLLVSGFSEFETYGNFMMTFYPQECRTKIYRTQREAVYVLGSKPTRKQLEWASKSYDIISIEVNDYGPTIFTILSSISIVRQIITMKTLCKLRFNLRKKYRKLVCKPDFVIEENL